MECSFTQTATLTKATGRRTERELTARRMEKAPTSRQTAMNTRENGATTRGTARESTRHQQVPSMRANGKQGSSMARVSSTLLTAHVIMVHGPRVRTQTREFTKIQMVLHWAVSWHAKRCSHNSRLSGRAAAIKITVSTSLSTFL